MDGPNEDSQVSSSTPSEGTEKAAAGEATSSGDSIPQGASAASRENAPPPSADRLSHPVASDRLVGFGLAPSFSDSRPRRFSAAPPSLGLLPSRAAPSSRAAPVSLSPAALRIGARLAAARAAASSSDAMLDNIGSQLPSRASIIGALPSPSYTPSHSHTTTTAPASRTAIAPARLDARQGRGPVGQRQYEVEIRLANEPGLAELPETSSIGSPHALEQGTFEADLRLALEKREEAPEAARKRGARTEEVVRRQTAGEEVEGEEEEEKKDELDGGVCVPVGGEEGEEEMTEEDAVLLSPGVPGHPPQSPLPSALRKGKGKEVKSVRFE